MSRTGDPIADVYFVEKSDNRLLLGVADGDVWGDRVRAASVAVLRSIYDRMSKGCPATGAAALTEMEKSIDVSLRSRFV